MGNDIKCCTGTRDKKQDHLLTLEALAQVEHSKLEHDRKSSTTKFPFTAGKSADAETPVKQNKKVEFPVSVEGRRESDTTTHSEPKDEMVRVSVQIDGDSTEATRIQQLKTRYSDTNVTAEERNGDEDNEYTVGLVSKYDIFLHEDLIERAEANLTDATLARKTDSNS